jgi:chromosome segregation ATPase
MTDELATALEDFGQAYARVEAALATTLAAPDTAFAALVKLDEALTIADRFLPALRRLLAVADPGKDATAQLERVATQLLAVRSKIGEIRSRLLDQQAPAAELAAAKTEYARLRSQLRNLQRDQNLNERLPELRRNVAELSEATSASRMVNLTAQHELKTSLSDWNSMASDLLAQLEPRLAGTYRRAQEKRRELAEKLEAERDAESNLTDCIEELEAASARHEETLKRTEQLLARLRLHAEADRRIVDALRASGIDIAGADLAVGDVDEALRRYEKGLHEIDAALKSQLEIRAAHPSILRLGDAPAG